MGKDPHSKPPSMLNKPKQVDGSGPRVRFTHLRDDGKEITGEGQLVAGTVGEFGARVTADWGQEYELDTVAGDSWEEL